MQGADIRELAAAMAAIDVIAAGFPAVLVGSPLLSGDVRAELAAIGGRAIAEIEWAAIDDRWPGPATAALYALDARGTSEEQLAAALPRIDAAAGDGAPVIVRVDAATIDVVAAALFGPRVQILCDPDTADLALALTLARDAIERPGLHDNRAHENEAAKLRQLNEEVARIAEVLARIGQRGAAEQRGEPSDVFDRRQSFEIKPIHDITIDASEIRRAIKARRLRDQFFGAGLFEEPGWDCLLDLFAAELEGARVSVSSLCIAAGVAPTTALRWISKLTEIGLLERRPDPFDRRRAYMELSERASRAMRDYIAAMRRIGLSLA